MLWRQAALAVELCQRAAEMAGEVLLGSLPARQPGQHCPAMTAIGKAPALAAAGVRAGASAANGYGFCAAGPPGCRGGVTFIGKWRGFFGGIWQGRMCRRSAVQS